MANTWLSASSYHPLAAPATSGRAACEPARERKWLTAEEIDAKAREVAAKQRARRQQEEGQ